MASQTSPLPTWLEKAQRPGYLADVDRMLRERESERDKYSDASKHREHPSTTHRIIHKPATAFKDDDLITRYSVAHAYLPHNVTSNRYLDVAPYDRTRVVVGHLDATGHLDIEPAGRYLNASWVRESAGKKWWIATQAPLPRTFHAFLTLIAQPITRPLDTNPSQASQTGLTSQIRTVVQLTQVREGGTQKAHFYFPQVPGESWITAPEAGCHAPALRITLIDRTTIEDAGCIQSTVSIQPLSGSGPSAQPEGEPAIFNHMFYEGWPDRDVPRDPDSLLRFALLVDKVNRDLSSREPEVRAKLDPDPPIVVGCSAGIGRTGTFIGLSSLLRAHHFLPPCASRVHDGDSELPEIDPSPLGELPDEFKEDMVAQEVDALREQRPGMVQKASQMKLIYELLLSLLLKDADGERKEETEKS